MKASAVMIMEKAVFAGQKFLNILMALLNSFDTFARSLMD
jgi:hypothetical protein